MKHKTAELIGAELDAAVAKAQGFAILSHNGETWAEDGEHGFLVGYIGGPAQHVPSYSPSTDWQDGGPIIEREQINVFFLPATEADGKPDLPEVWEASIQPEGQTVVCQEDGSLVQKVVVAYGPTPLSAAMRAHVKAKMGDEVDL